MPFDDEATSLTTRSHVEKLSAPMRFFVFAVFFAGLASVIPVAVVSPTIITYMTSVRIPFSFFFL
jgi:hypothetical protein